MLFDIDFDVSVDNVTPIDLSLEQQEKIKQFIYAEARLLDERQWEQWLALWTEDGMYWVPHSFDQQGPYDHISLFWENKMLRELRMKRLENARNWSQQPPTRSSRLISNVTVAGTDEQGYLVVQANFQVLEWRKAEQRLLGGSYIYKLKAHQDSWQLYLKQVNLVNREDVHSSLEIHL